MHILMAWEDTNALPLAIFSPSCSLSTQINLHIFRQDVNVPVLFVSGISLGMNRDSISEQGEGLLVIVIVADKVDLGIEVSSQ